MNLIAKTAVNESFYWMKWLYMTHDTHGLRFSSINFFEFFFRRIKEAMKLMGNRYAIWTMNRSRIPLMIELFVVFLNIHQYTCSHTHHDDDDDDDCHKFIDPDLMIIDFGDDGGSFSRSRSSSSSSSSIIVIMIALVFILIMVHWFNYITSIFYVYFHQKKKKKFISIIIDRF